MKTVLNFSHPLNPDAARVLQEEYGVQEIVQVPFHLDTNRPIVPQVAEVTSAVRKEHGEPDYIILPGFAPAAVLVARAFPRAKIVRLAAQGTPPKWMPVEVL